MKATRLEKDLYKEISQFFSGVPKLWYFKTNTVILKGIPDIIGVINGRFFAWELKRAKVGKVTKLQRVTLAMIARAGGHVRIVDDNNLHEAMQELLDLAE